MDSFPQELLTEIIQDAHDPISPAETVNMMLVCKAWKTLAECVLYTSVILDSELSTRLFKRRVMESALFKDDMPVGHLVRELLLDAGDIDWKVVSERDYLNSLVCILSHSPALRSYKVRGDFWNSEGSEIACLSGICGSTLTSLSISIRESKDDMLLMINRLSRLRKLRLNFEVDISDSPAPWPLHSLHLQEVTDLHWAYWDEDDLDMLDYFSSCQYAPRCKVTIDIPNLEGVNALRLIPFFKRNQVIELNLETNLEAQAELASTIVTLPHLQILGYPPSSELLQVGSLADRMTFDFPVNKEEAESMFWNFLDAMAKVDYPPGPVKIVQIYYRHRQLFSWDTSRRLESYATFIGKLLPFAAKLYKRNIRVVDVLGNDVTAFANWPDTD